MKRPSLTGAGEIGDGGDRSRDNFAAKNLIAETDDSRISNADAWRVEDNHYMPDGGSQLRGIDANGSILDIFREAVAIADELGIPERVGVAARCR